MIVLPANTGFSSAAWEQVLERVEQGAVFVCFGAADRDDAGLPVQRTNNPARELSRVEPFILNGADAETAMRIRIPDEIVQSMYGARMDSLWREEPRGRGQIRQVGVPWDVVGRTDLLVILFKPLFERAAPVERNLIPISQRKVSKDLVLCFAVNESSRAEMTTIYTTPSGTTVRREIPPGRGMVYAISPATGAILDQYPPATH